MTKMVPVIQRFCILSVVLQICHNVQGASPLASAWLEDEDGDNIPGRAGVDYPTHSSVPAGTRFRCSDHDYAGYFGDQETGCQAYHVCFPDGRNASFLCVNGTVFHQRFFVCDWWFHFDCSGAINMYELNLYRKVPLPVLPPLARRPFPGRQPDSNPKPPASNPNRNSPSSKPNSPSSNSGLPKRNSGRNSPTSDDRNGKKKLRSNDRLKPENKYKDLKAENKYKDPSSEEKCDCQCR